MSASKITSFPAPLRIPETVRAQILRKLRKNFRGGENGHLFFRYVSAVIPIGKPTLIRHSSPTESEVITSTEGMSADDQKRYIERDFYNSETRKHLFYAFTHGNAVRSDEPKDVKGVEFHLNPSKHGQIDFTLDYTFKFTKNAAYKPTTPAIRDLVLIFVSNETIEKMKKREAPRNPPADGWCVVSNQLLHMFDLIMYDWHETFDKMVPKNTPEEERESIIKRKVMRGNHLVVNTWMKAKHALAAKGEDMPKELSDKLYWHLRREYSGIRWLHIYCAVVLIARYGELPCMANIPNNADDTPRNVVWDLPIELVSALVHLGDDNGELDDSDIENYSEWSELFNRRSKGMYSYQSNGRLTIGYLEEVARLRVTANEKSEGEEESTVEATANGSTNGDSQTADPNVDDASAYPPLGDVPTEPKADDTPKVSYAAVAKANVKTGDEDSESTPKKPAKKPTSWTDMSDEEDEAAEEPTSSEEPKSAPKKTSEKKPAEKNLEASKPVRKPVAKPKTPPTKPLPKPTPKPAVETAKPAAKSKSPVVVSLPSKGVRPSAVVVQPSDDDDEQRMVTISFTFDISSIKQSWADME